jgi:protein O-GlcNAc transferase
MPELDEAKRLFSEGVERLNNRDFRNAEKIFLETLQLLPRHLPTLMNLALSQYQQKKFVEAIRSFETIISINPSIAEAHSNKAAILNELREYPQAIASADSAIAIQPQFSDAFLNRGNALFKLGKYDEALVSYEKVLTITPDHVGGWLGLGNGLTELKRYDEAFTAYDRALALDPDLEGAWLGRGNVLHDLKRYDEAFAAYDKALALNSGLAEAWLGRGDLLFALKRHDDAVAAYDKALALKSGLEGAWLGRGNVFSDLKRYAEAFAAYDRALALKPDFTCAWLARGNVFYDLKRYDEAFAAYDKALALAPDLEGAWLGCGNAFYDVKRYDEAFAAYDRAFSLNPDVIGAEGARLHSKTLLCDWRNLHAEYEHLIRSVNADKASTAPFALIAISSSAEAQLKCAKTWSATNYPQFTDSVWCENAYRHEKIRIGYVSADFHQHATSYLIAGIFACHDRSKFEVTAFSIGPAEHSELRKRLESSFDRFSDVGALSDDEIALRIKKAEVDILIDLKGLTQNRRTGIFARRPAPIQVSYLGYPGTMGAAYIDYIVADSILIPASQREHYSEKIVYLPHSYQANDAQREISGRLFSRAECGLPEREFVFCCFNNSYKILPHVFDCWMRLLAQVEGSVLWLLQDNDTAAKNLRKEAVARGVNADRLVFAGRLPLPEHLARHRLADLFLDTLPCNAHTTASDALWAGLPVLTEIGETFAGRVAASLLNAIGLSELIAKTQDEYEKLAIALAKNPDRLASIRNKLEKNRLTMPLFNTPLITRNIETAYAAIHERFQAGLSPDHIEVPDLTAT